MFMAKAGKRVKIIAAICLAVLLAAIFALSPYIDAYRVNRHLNIDGVRLLMTPGQVEELMGKGSPVGGFGAEFYRYRNSTVTVAYPFEGMLKGKAGWIDIKDPKYDIYGVRPGDSADKARLILRKFGFTQDKDDKSCFKRGSSRVYFFGDSVRIIIEDWTLRGRVY